MSTALLAPVSAQGRGDYFNVESPQVSAIAVASIGGVTGLLICNTPDNSIEIWQPNAQSVPIFQQRLPVGLEPVSVTVSNNRFYTANFLGDSVTTGVIELVSGSLRARVTRTEPVGDEPMDVAAYDHEGVATILVTLHSRSELRWLDGISLLPHLPSDPAWILQQPSGQVPGDPPFGLKEPRAVRVRGNRVYALGNKGGRPGLKFDLDVLSADLHAIQVPPQFDVSLPNRSIQGSPSLGTTNSNMRIDSSGALWVVGGEAKNLELGTKTLLKDATTGFVESFVYRVTNPNGTATKSSRNLNVSSSGAPVAKTGATEGKPIALPSDIAIHEVAGIIQRVFIAGFGSDRLCVLTPPTVGGGLPNPGADLGAWVRSTIDLRGSDPLLRRGPRSMVLADTPSGKRLFVMCRLDNSVVCVNPATLQVVQSQSFHLTYDPTPIYVKRGRRFLYDADLSGSGFVSCASCHTDGRTDALAWRLGDPAATPVEPKPSAEFIRSLAGTGTLLLDATQTPANVSDPIFLQRMIADQSFAPGLSAGVQTSFVKDDKREMVTQSLQGLLNFEVAMEHKVYFTNAPYHWRGDKPSLRDFNEAFVTLLGSADVDGGSFAAGLTEAEMDVFEEFLHSINYPPNPQQPKSRLYSSAADGTGGADGLRLFHELPNPVLGDRSCVHCHSLPVGTNKRLTVFAFNGVITGFIEQLNRQPIESAALRGLLQKEPALEPDGKFPASTLTTRIGHYGLNHNGVQPITQSFPTTINTFVDLFFTANTQTATAKAVKQFVHEMDWGIAPIVGESVWRTSTNSSFDLANRFGLMVSQANSGNAGLVAWLNRPSNATSPVVGLRWSPNQSTWILETMVSGSPVASFWTTADLLNALTQPDDILVALSVPLGSERRLAGNGGPQPPPIPFFPPSNIALMPMPAGPAWTSVPSFIENWTPPGGYVGNHPIPSTFFDFGVGIPKSKPQAVIFNAAGAPQLIPTDDVFAKAIRIYQYALLDPNPTTSPYGLPRLRHEAPRRLRISGQFITSGAVLRLGIPGQAGVPGLTPKQAKEQGSTFPAEYLELPLYPTSTKVSGHDVWETAVELEPMLVYQLLLGGRNAPGVMATLDNVYGTQYDGLPLSMDMEPASVSNIGVVQQNDAFVPEEWNWYRVSVRNSDGQASAEVWQQLRMQ